MCSTILCLSPKWDGHKLQWVVNDLCFAFLTLQVDFHIHVFCTAHCILHFGFLLFTGGVHRTNNEFSKNTFIFKDNTVT